MEDGYRVERAPDAGGAAGEWATIAVLPSNTITFSSTGLEIGTSNWYRATPFNLYGDGTTATVTATTISLPAAPSGLQAIAVTSDFIDLSWTDHCDNETSFRIERRTATPPMPRRSTQPGMST